ncbi:MULTISPECIES: hypothetical protein [Sphingobacterium]|uniref:hypothetical protein n=1 Tax=Sphingobacterium TaxID=28453 RepID=UPI00257B94FF|nr:MULTISPECIES: hypothetical protein [Sphingobacterium]
MEPLVSFLLAVGNDLLSFYPNESFATLSISGVTYRFIFLNGVVSQIRSLNGDGTTSAILYNL